MPTYDSHFFSHVSHTAKKSAAQIVPLLIDLTKARSVVDVGCGTGEWLAAFIERGITDICGIDGPWVDQSRLAIPADRFLVSDLSQSLRHGREYDLVLSLEVAEHLPISAANAFVDSLTKLGRLVVFSAAIPFQGGTDHVNEQWPEFWTEQFDRLGYVAIDCIRPRIWRNRNVEWFYAQNMLLFVREDRLTSLSLVNAKTPQAPLSMVHPTKYSHVVNSLHDCRTMLATAHDLVSIIPPGECFIFVDQDQLRSSILPGARAIPFTERNGQYWGPPADDATAIAELTRLLALRPTLLVVAWPAFWWLDFYQGFAAHVRQTFPCIHHNERLIVFDLTT